MKKTYYTAVGHFCRKTDAIGRSYPVILVNGKEYMVDIQEMTVWTALNWRLLDISQVEAEYDRLTRGCTVPERRTMKDCLGRLCTRGLAASGTGDTDFEALYDLLGRLYVTPLSNSLPTRLAAFFRLVVLRGVPLAKAKALLRQDKRSGQEARIMRLARQALMSVGELVKCMEVGAEDVSTDEKLMRALYDDDYTTDLNIADMMRTAKWRKGVTEAIANLYLRKQIIFERI